MTALTITLALVAVVAAALAVVLLVAWRRSLARAVRRQEAADRETEALRARLDALEARTATPAARAAEQEFVITHLGEPEPAAGSPGATPVKVSLSGPAFADAVVRESVVRTASLVQGVRRALAPEVRHRIRFEMKRELKRSRKARKVELKEALREYRARRRAQVPDEGVA
ncbi:hypothetical protein [Nocardioides sp.]|uniref:hypothetical protein n=1 Tax=Nocardioides sp. TaxID=35761 RepID=UPI002D1DB220|nr:hypothetical protein [Nocardioides sp.]HVX54496.1 hypothetical protein [Nocardioides sp.]